MQPAARRANEIGETGLERGMHVLVFEANLPCAVSEVLPEILQAIANRIAVISGNKFLLGKHLSVSKRCEDVVRNKARIE